jgi:SAM-dependent methyltransferase
VRTILYDLLRRVAAQSPPEPIVEFGASRALRQLHLPSVRSLFPGTQFSGTDLEAGVGVDQLQDLRQIGIRDGSVGTVLLLDTIEHVEDPFQAIRELHRCLKSDGVLLLTTHFFFPIHRFPADYWRFTADGIRALLKDFPRSHAQEGGLRLFPHTTVGLAGGADLDAARWQGYVGAVDEWLKHGANTWKERTLASLPPVLSERLYYRYARVGSSQSQ